MRVGKQRNFGQIMGLLMVIFFFLRDKKEADFLVTKNAIPWFLVEVKTKNHSGISKSLHLFQKQTGVKHAFGVVFDRYYVEIDYFLLKKPMVVHLCTFLFQLV